MSAVQGGPYVVFRRTAKNWEAFSRAGKFVIRKGLTREEARSMCSRLNGERTPGQIRRGVAFEFTTGDAL